MRMTLSTRNVKGTVVNLLGRAAAVRRAVRDRVVETGERELAIATALCPVDTGFMRDHITLEFTPGFFQYELGWYEDDFFAAGLPFYPPYQEFGTVNMAAQPCLFPARDAVRPEFERGLRDDLRAAWRRRV